MSAARVQKTRPLQAPGSEAPLPARRALPRSGGGAPVAAHHVASIPVHASRRPHPALDRATPAWADGGRIVLGPAAFLLPPAERAGLLHHETVHALHQLLAAREESAPAREHAERLAERGGPGLPPLAELLTPVPRLLAAPVTGTAAKGLSRLFVGETGIVAEVVDSGVTVRAERGYAQLGIDGDPDPKRFIACGTGPLKALSALAEGMRSVARQIAVTNRSSARRVELVLITSETSRLHLVDGKPLITISHADFDKAAQETAAHEGSHAVFEGHSHPVDPSVLAPDTLALRVADLWARLEKTRQVAIPTQPFDAKKPPHLEPTTDESVEAAGVVMVEDALFQKTSTNRIEGHPWDGPDELFASAFAAFLVQRKLLEAVIAFYAKADPSLKALGGELVTLLEAVGDPRKLKAVKPPNADQARDAEAAIRKREDVGPSPIKDLVPVLFSPETLPPEKVTCSGSPKPADTTKPAEPPKPVVSPKRAESR